MPELHIKSPLGFLKYSNQSGETTATWVETLPQASGFESYEEAQEFLDRINMFEWGFDIEIV